MHVPLQHPSVVLHASPQLAQLVTVPNGVHIPSQHPSVEVQQVFFPVDALTHSVKLGPHLHCPPVQVELGGQASPQPAQSVTVPSCVQVPLQHPCVELQQVFFPVDVLTHSVKLALHLHCPPVQIELGGQASPQLAQFWVVPTGVHIPLLQHSFAALQQETSLP